MAITSTLTLLENVQTAIRAIETTGQSYTLDGQTLTRGDLSTLYKREDQLIARYNQETLGKRPRMSQSSFSEVTR